MDTLRDFESFLQDEFFKDNADMMILDDDYPDAFDNYISNVSPAEIKEKAQVYYEKYPPLMMRIMGRVDFMEYFYDPAEQLTKDYCKQQGIV